MKLRTTPQRPRSARSTLRRLGRYLMRSAPMLALALILTLAGNVFALIGPTLCRLRHRRHRAPGAAACAFDVVFYYAWRMLALYILSALMNYVVSLLILRVSQRTVRAMRADVFAKLMKLPVGYFDGHQTGEYRQPHLLRHRHGERLAVQRSGADRSPAPSPWRAR